MMWVLGAVLARIGWAHWLTPSEEDKKKGKDYRLDKQNAGGAGSVAFGEDAFLEEDGYQHRSKYAENSCQQGKKLLFAFAGYV